MRTAAIFAGSFDPFTIGHLEVANRAKALFDDVYIVKAFNITKKRHERIPLPDSLATKYGFKTVTLGEGDLLTDFISRVEHSRLEVYGAYSGYKAITLIRGLRNGYDFEYEQKLADNYRKYKHDINIVYFMATPELTNVSSTRCRDSLETNQHLIVK